MMVALRSGKSWPHNEWTTRADMCLAVPGKILDIHGPAESVQRAGRVSFGGVIKQVNLACVPEAKVGDYVVVHVGLALSTIDKKEAERTLEYFRQIGELAELEMERRMNPEEAAKAVPPHSINPDQSKR